MTDEPGSSAALTFSARIKLKGINPYVLVSAARSRRIRPDWKKPMPVLVQVNGRPEPAWPINMMPAGDGSFFLYLDRIVHAASSTCVGDLGEVSIAFDAHYRSGPQHELPPAFASGLDANSAAKMRWESLSPSLRKEVLRYLASLKTDGARQRNVERAIRVLGGAKERFLARDWN